MFVVFGLTRIPRISLIFLWVVNLTELFGGEVGGFWAHTDSTDLTDFFVGGKSHIIVSWGVGVVFWAHTDPTDLTELH